MFDMQITFKLHNIQNTRWLFWCDKVCEGVQNHVFGLLRCNFVAFFSEIIGHVSNCNFGGLQRKSLA